MIDREFEELLSKYEVTHWDPCKGICVIGKCEQSSTVGCCPTIHIPIVPTPTPTGNTIKSEFVIDNNKDVYYVDVAGNSILLEKVTTLTDTINGHQIGVYFNELQAPVTLNETVTSMGEVTLTGTILNIPYTDENGNTIVRSVDLSGFLGTVRVIQRPTGISYNLKPTGIIIHNDFDISPEALPDPTINAGAVVEVRNFSGSTMTLSYPVYLNPAITINTLQPYGSNSYNNPTYIRILSDGTRWIVLNQW